MLLLLRPSRTTGITTAGLAMLRGIVTSLIAAAERLISGDAVTKSEAKRS